MINSMEAIKKIVEDTVTRIGFERFEVDVKEEEPPFFAGEDERSAKKLFRIFVRIDEDTSLLIGYRGSALLALQHVLRLAAQKQMSPCPALFLDINGYRQQREEYLRSVAKKAARQASLTKRPVELEPMSAAERRIIHSELAAYPELTTQSQGDGEERRVVVLPLQVL